MNEKRRSKGAHILLVGATFGLLAACHPEPPSFWDEGGARLSIPRAELRRPGPGGLLIYPDGRVVQDGDVLWVLDRVGRVTDADYEPIALLLRSGELIGTRDEYLGRVGLRNATPPWTGLSWLRVSPEGKLLLFNEVGHSVYGGKWTGCEGPGLRVCTLVSQLAALASVRMGRSRSVSIGVGYRAWR